MTLNFSGGDSYEIDFDQGMGAWMYTDQRRWESSASIDRKARLLKEDSGRVNISGKWGTLVNFRKLPDQFS